MSKKLRLATIGLGASIVAFHAWSLMRFPFPFVDEAWRASRVWAFIQTGRNFGALDAGILERFPGHWTIFPWLSTFVQSLALRLVAEPELLPLRIVSLVFGFILLIDVYAIVYKLYGRRLGLLSVLIVSVSWPFLYSSHLARCDIMAAVLGFTAIALYLNNPADRFWPGLLSGLCLGAAFEVHPYGAIYVPALGVLYFYHAGWHMFRQRHFWGLVAGGLAGGLGYVALHILPFPQTYSAFNTLAYRASHTPPILTLNPAVLGQSVGDMGRMLTFVYQAMVPVILLALLILAKRRSQADKTLLVLNAALVGSAVLIIRAKLDYYAILITPSIDVMAGISVLYLAGQPWRQRIQDYAVRVLVWGLFAGAIVLNLAQARINMWPFCQTAQARINQSIRAEDTIVAAQTYWLGLYDHSYYSWEELVRYQRYAPGSTLKDAFRELHPSILVIDGHLSQFISDAESGSSASPISLLSKSEMDAFLSHYAELIDEFTVEYCGSIQVFRIHWERDSAGDQHLPAGPGAPAICYPATPASDHDEIGSGWPGCGWQANALIFKNRMSNGNSPVVAKLD